MSNNSSEESLMLNSNPFGVGNRWPENFYVGMFYFLYAGAIIAAYIPCLVFLAKDKELRKKLSYQIIFFIGVADLFTTVCHLITGIMTMIDSVGHFWLIKVIGAIAKTGWYSYCGLLQILSLNRFVHFVCPKYMNKVFSKRMIIFWWIFEAYHTFSCVGLILSPYCSFIYILDMYAWTYYGSHAWLIGGLINKYVAGFYLGLTGLEYLACYVVVRGMRKSINTENEQAAANAAKNERIMAIQGVILTVYPTIVLWYWYYGLTLLPLAWAYWIPMSANIIWIGNAAVNPIIYLTINDTMKKGVKKLLFGGGGSVQPGSISGHGTNTTGTAINKKKRWEKHVEADQADVDET